MMDDFDVEEVKRYGAERGLMESISTLQHQLEHNWDDTRKGMHYHGLGMAIDRGEMLLRRMRAILSELSKMDLNHD